MNDPEMDGAQSRSLNVEVMTRRGCSPLSTPSHAQLRSQGSSSSKRSVSLTRGNPVLGKRRGNNGPLRNEFLTSLMREVIGNYM